MRWLPSVAVMALCLVSLFVGGTLVRVVLLMRDPPAAFVLAGVMVLLVLVIWGTGRTNAVATPYW